MGYDKVKLWDPEERGPGRAGMGDDHHVMLYLLQHPVELGKVGVDTILLVGGMVGAPVTLAHKLNLLLMT